MKRIGLTLLGLSPGVALLAVACGLSTAGEAIVDDTADGGASAPDGSIDDAAYPGLALSDDAAGYDGGPEANNVNGGCNFDGAWASRLTIDVNWSPQGLMSIILAPGSGQIKQWLKGTRVMQGSIATDSTVICGVALPDFMETALAGSETYGVRFPDSLFDPPRLPLLRISGTLTASTYTANPTAALLGLVMANPTTDPWPATVTTATDPDGDGEPGITIDVAQGAPYSDVPVDIPAAFQQPNRADKLYVAIRQVTTVTASVVDCDHMSGSVTIPQLSGKAAIDSHVLGCALVDGGDCSTTAPSGSLTQAAFVDNTQPVFTPTGSSNFESVRIPPDAGSTCAAVRSLLP